MTRETYLVDPCGASSLPFWKTNAVRVPADMLILRDDDPRLPAALNEYRDAPYFKLIHTLDQVDRPELPKGFRFVTPDESELSKHIAACYEAERASSEELAACRLRPTFRSDLWLAVADERTGEIVASGVAELDERIGEGILEWVQVSPVCRRRGFGRAVVGELLYRLRGRAAFVTVSGKADDPCDPRALYERCGFGGGMIWHILRKV